ncbi:hypothetical protein DFH07DRAFT_972653 [Mycena maculata]|uniref:Uncharacterized protein n=1 Tax=Mycena maculata TaxID=230809 RepID=A0AAD7HGU8_9AGAR|nr:hypothetical protein DFH07DRAFT_972653 [Mycena maculata]
MPPASRYRSPTPTWHENCKPWNDPKRPTCASSPLLVPVSVLVPRAHPPPRTTQLVRQLQLRLQYAKLKVDHGWQQQHLNEVENLYFRQQRHPDEAGLPGNGNGNGNGSGARGAEEYPPTALLTAPLHTTAVGPNSSLSFKLGPSNVYQAHAPVQGDEYTHASGGAVPYAPADSDAQPEAGPSTQAFRPSPPRPDPMNQWLHDTPMQDAPSHYSHSPSPSPTKPPAASYDSFWSAHPAAPANSPSPMAFAPMPTFAPRSGNGVTRGSPLRFEGPGCIGRSL